MTYYCGIDLHSNNHYVCVIDENDNRVFERKLDNEARLLIACLAEFKDKLIAVAIESTFNWYWLSDALIAYSGEDDRHFRGNVTDGFNLPHWKLKRNVIGHDQSTFSVFS